MIDLIFKLLNFAILIGLAWYGFARLSPTLKKAVDGQKMLVNDLRQEHQVLKQDEQNLLMELEVQEASCSTLYDKVDSWKAAVVERENKQGEEFEAFAQEVEKKRALQTRIHTLKGIYQQVAPEVVARLEKEARIYYSDENKAHHAITRIIKNLKH